MKTVPKRCIDAVMKYCDNCEYGITIYPEWVETKEDMEGVCYKTKCLYGLENTKPTNDEVKAFNEYMGEGK